MSMFRLGGLLLAGYIARCLVRGEVFAKSGVWGKACHRGEQPFEYWSTMAVYTCLTLALLFWF